MAVGLTLLGCGSAAASFRPYSAVTPAGEGITPEAVKVLEGDVKYLNDVATAIVGTVIVTGHDRAELEHKAACIAAKNGGTHIVKSTEWSSISGTHSALFVTGNAAFAATRVNTVESEQYLVLRLARQEWPKLPEPLRPAGVETFKKPVWNGDPDIWECR